MVFTSWFYAVIRRVLDRLDAPPVFLVDYLDALDSYAPPGASPSWWLAEIDRAESEALDHQPLRTLDRDAALVLVAAGLLEEDIRFGALFASLQEPLLSRRPCIGLLDWLLNPPGHPALDVLAASRDLIDSGMVIVDNAQDARAEWTLRVPPVVWDAVRGRLPLKPAPGMDYQHLSDFPPLDALIFDADLGLDRLPSLLDTGQVGALILRGLRGSGRRTLAGAAARRDVLLCDLAAMHDTDRSLIQPLARLSGALPVLRVESIPGETVTLPDLPQPCAITLGRSGGVRGPSLDRALTLSLPAPGFASRRRFWQGTGIPVEDTDTIAERFLLTGGIIRQAAAIAGTYAALDGRDGISTADVQQATSTLNRQALDTHAVRLEAARGWSDLVVGESVRGELAALEARCHARESLREKVGPAFASNLNRGVRALFSGPSGTGKTLAARALAAALQMDLYRVDLASVVNKYIGETERNLNEVFSRAEELDVILLLDEGDSLMSRRTDVRSSNDRYANLETNYLLQRLEHYEGIILITTNAGQRIDSAFLRRLDVVVDFALPEADERRRLWAIHLPLQHAIAPALLDEVVRRCALSGGQIRGAALFAALLAHDAGGDITDENLLAALRREYRKSGAAFPLHDTQPTASQIDRLRRFTNHHE